VKGLEGLDLPSIELKEADIKATCESFLYSLMNMDKLVYLRLNSGDLIIGEGKAKRRVRCCPKGTSDGLVMFAKESANNGYVIFVEYKREGAKQTREQKEFDCKVCGMGFDYWLVSDAQAFMDEIGKLL
jgi:hypothetical protein